MDLPIYVMTQDPRILEAFMNGQSLPGVPNTVSREDGFQIEIAAPTTFIFEGYAWAGLPFASSEVARGLLGSGWMEADPEQFLAAETLVSAL